MKKNLKLKLLVLIISAFLSMTFSSVAGSDKNLDSLISIAIKVSPKIQELRYNKEAAVDRIPQNSNLPDPMLTLGLMNMPVKTFSFSEEPMTGKTIGISQAFPFPGKLGSIERWQAIDTSVVNEEIRETENDISKNIKDLYYKLIYVRKSLSATDSIRKLLKSIRDVVNVKYSVATASQQNLLKVQIEFTNLDDDILDLKSSELELINKINAYLLRNSETEIITGEFPNPDSFGLGKNDLLEMAKSYSPSLKILELQKEKSVLSSKVSNYNYYPDFNIMLEYAQRNTLYNNISQSDLFSASLGISIPLNYGGKISAQIQEALALKESYISEYNAMLQSLDGNFGASVSTIARLESRIKLQEEGLLPQAEENLNSSLTAYRVGEIDFINVIDAEKMLYDIEVKLYHLKSDYMIDLVELEFLTGTNIIK